MDCTAENRNKVFFFFVIRPHWIQFIQNRYKTWSVVLALHWNLHCVQLNLWLPYQWPNQPRENYDGTHDRLFTPFLHDINSDSAKCAAVEVLSTVLDHVLRVGARHRPLVPLWAPRAIPVETTDNLAGGRVDEIERACGSLCGMFPSTCVDLHLVVGRNGFPFIFTLIDLSVLVAFEIKNIRKLKSLQSATWLTGSM